MNKDRLRPFLKKVDPEGRLFENFYRAVRGGNNRVFQNIVTEAISLDDSWVLSIEACLYSVEQIAKNPRKFIAEEESVVDVERARRTNAKTIRHLASHSRNVNSINDDGTVMPRRVLTTEMVEDWGIYENRFVCSLINRLVTFVETRNNEIKDKFHVYDLTTVHMDSAFRYGKAELTYKMEVTVKEPPYDKVLLEKNYELMHRIDNIRRRLRILKNTEFYKKLKDAKPVKPPILKTNMIKMNVDYGNCYKLWLFISSYTFVGYSVEIKDKNLPVDTDYYDDMTLLSALSVRALVENQAIRDSVYRDIPFSEPREKAFKVRTNYRYVPKFIEDKRAPEDDSVNEYFFLKMKEALKKASESAPRYAEERELTMSFGRFYRAVTKISNEMYRELIEEQAGPKKTGVRRTHVKVRQDEYDRQLKIYKRYKILSKLKAEELERTLKRESRELVKLERAKYELDQVRERATNRRLAEEKKRKKLAEIKAKSFRVKEAAAAAEQELLMENYEERMRLEEEKRLKREEAKRRRELRQLEKLREKYEDERE